MRKFAVIMAAGASMLSLLLLAAGPALAGVDDTDRIVELEKKVDMLMDEIESLKSARENADADDNVDASPRQSEAIARLEEDVASLKEKSGPSVLERFSFGGYGEVHANFSEGDGADIFDIHRLVAYIGYDFADWIKLSSEIELEHAFVNKGSGGEISIEQLYVDFLISDYANARAGRMLAPLGIINRRHEPPSFNGVERPNFAKYIIPATWSVDGAGLFGSLADWLTYEAYVVAGLDGSGFSAVDGIRGGRIKERPSLNDIAYTGRLDFYPLIGTDLTAGSDLRVGVSAYHGGIDNGNKGKDPGIGGTVTIYSGDFQVSLHDLDLRGAVAFTDIDAGGALVAKGVAEEIFGYYVEAGYHFWPDAWKTGKLESSDCVVFARFDDYDTQFKVPAGVMKDPDGDRQDLTFGINFYPVPNLVIKADYQIRYSAAAEDPDNLINLGLGWQL